MYLTVRSRQFMFWYSKRRQRCSTHCRLIECAGRQALGDLNDLSFKGEVQNSQGDNKSNHDQNNVSRVPGILIAGLTCVALEMFKRGPENARGGTKP